ncbi:MAG: ABC transporter permease [Thermodesulfovibrionales bacterium]|nr:ABC transporter permease [Thermodesulfovibrionales bacterium]
MYIGYALKTALKGMYQEKWINLLSAFTVASSLFIVLLIGLILFNIELFAGTIHERYGLVVFLKDNLSELETQSVITEIHKKEGVISARYISKEDALKEIKDKLKDVSYVFEGLDTNPLSASIELRLKKDFITPEKVKTLSKNIKEISGVDEVFSAEKIAETIDYFNRSLSNMSLIVLIALISGVIFVIYSTVKILFYRRKEEIETVKLLGATRAFIRLPFLIEGATIGFIGGLISTAATLVIYFAITYRLSNVFPILQNLVFPNEVIVVFPIVGLILGVLGAFVAVGKLRF